MDDQFDEQFEVGDKLQIQYLTDRWDDVTVIEVRSVDADLARDLKRAFTDVKEGDALLLCDDGYGDQCLYLPAHQPFRRGPE